MLSERELHRYSRHIILDAFGLSAQQKLKSATVLVIGCGGLSHPALQYLNAAGVGTIKWVDADRVDPSNLQRQILFDESDQGRYKVDVAAEKLAKQNPWTHLVPIRSNFNADNALALLEGVDVVIDGCDNFATRYLVNDACIIRGVPFVYGAIFKFSAQVSVFNHQGGPSYRCLYPEPPEAGEMPGCGEIGVLGVVPGLAGSLQALEAIKVITGVGNPLSGKLWCADFLTNVHQVFDIERMEQNFQITQLSDSANYCIFNFESINYDDYLNLKEKCILIDVRSEQEHQQQNIGGINVPVERWPAAFDDLQLDPIIPVILHCKSGIRAKRVAQLSIWNGFQVKVLEGLPL